MQKVIILPKCNRDKFPHILKDQLNNDDTIIVDNIYTELSELIEYFSDKQSISAVIGNESTPAIYWIAVNILYPNTTFMLQTSNKVIDVKSGEIFLDDPQKTINIKEESPKKICKHSQMKDGELLYEIFKISSWGLTDKGNKLHINQLLEEAASRKLRNPKLLNRAQSMKNQGLKAYSLYEAEIKPKINKLTTDDFDTYYKNFKQENSELSKKTLKSIDKKVKKDIKYKHKKIGLHKIQKKTTSLLKEVEFVETHPNSILNLAPSNNWDVVIDETGSIFEKEGKDLSLNSTELGKCIALVTPTNNNLPEIDKYHATDSVDEDKKDKIIESITTANIGILGFTIKDQIIPTSASWFSSIHTLIKWTLRLIPIIPNKKTTISFYIENRGIYNAEINLIPVIDLLLAELSDIDYEYYKNINIKAKFIDKNNEHKLNGYVDTVANMWGSKGKRAKERLKNSKMLGYCLIRPNDNTMERLYESLQDPSKLLPKEWYDIITANYNNSKNTLLTYFSNDLGELISRSKKLWSLLLDYIKEELKGAYSPLDISRALKWLEKWKPNDMKLEGKLLLQKFSVDFDSFNHLGKYDNNLKKRFVEYTKLRKDLFDEAAKDLCEIDLRVIISFTNLYDFSDIKKIIDFWKTKNIATVTLETWGKLLSTEGQYYAFTGNSEQAIKSFNQAIHTFSRLSDTTSRVMNIQWTNSYKTISMMDLQAPSITEIRTNIQQISNMTDLIKMSKEISVDTEGAKFIHHTIVRAFAYFPDNFSQEIKAYTATINDWFNGDTHPYQLINIYRAWLLYDLGKYSEAKIYANLAFKICEEENQGITVKWIGLALKLMANKIGIIEIEEDLRSKANILTSNFPNFPIVEFTKWNNMNSLSRIEIITLLKELLPFNFH